MTHTPWGKSDHQDRKAEGIVFHSTPSHGGYHLSPQRQQCVERRFPGFETFAGGPWYEEDQDCAIVVLTFPDLYSDSEVRSAIRSAECSARPFNFGTKGAPKVQRYPKWEQVVEWLNTTHDGAYLRQRAEKFEQEHADYWESGSCGTVSHTERYPRGCWSVSFRRIRDGERKTVVITDYPSQQFYTDEEIHSLTAKPLPPPEPVAVPFRESECSGAYDGYGNVYSDADPGL